MIFLISGVAFILTNEAKVFDSAVIAAAMLHDTVEDTKTTFDEIKEHFGQEVYNKFWISRLMSSIDSEFWIDVETDIGLCFKNFESWRS